MRERGRRTTVKRRVLMLLENNPYPLDVRVRHEATALAAAGYGVAVICPAGAEQTWHETLNGVSVYRFPAPREGTGLFGFVWEYGYSMVAMLILSLIVLCREGFDVVHAHNPPDTLVFIAVLYKLLGKKFVYDHHDLSPEAFRARFGEESSRTVYNVLVLLERLSCRLADHVIATNESYKTMEVQRDQVPEERITVVRNGPDLSEFQRVDCQPSLHRSGRTLLGYAGVMGTQDGVEYLIRALRYLVNELGRSNVLCVLVGAGDAMDGSKGLVEELDLAGHVLFTGWVDQAMVAAYLSEADICVAPEPSNPFNDRSTMIKMMEYMALAKPIVAFDLPEHRVSAQDAAVYARPNDDFDLAQQIALLMEDSARRESMAQIGRERVESQLAWCYSARKLLDAYQSVLHSSATCCAALRDGWHPGNGDMSTGQGHRRGGE
jgi:glycosyltransferase involved in cell wall biosynthesis